MITVFTSFTAKEIDEIREKWATTWVTPVNFSDVIWLTSDNKDGSQEGMIDAAA